MQILWHILIDFYKENLNSIEKLQVSALNFEIFDLKVHDKKKSKKSILSWFKLVYI